MHNPDLGAFAETVKTSVALCTHNGERFVTEQVRSILTQTRPVDEIVVSDDASTDATVELIISTVEQFQQEHGAAPILRVLKNDPALGVTKNFEQALLATTGDVIALSDQDDVWHRGRIETLLTGFLDSETLLQFSNARQVGVSGESLGHDLFRALEMRRDERNLIESGRAYEQFLRRNLVTGATTMLRRSLVEIAAPFPNSWLHDEWLGVVAAAHQGVKMLDLSLTDYRQHGGNLVGMKKLGLKQKFGMFAEPRTERNRRLYDRAKDLAFRVDGFEGVSGEYRAAAHEKFLFEQARQEFPASRISRVIPVAAQILRGRYSRYGTGFKDAVRNLLQPA